MPDVLLFPGHASYPRKRLEHELNGAEAAGIAKRMDRVATAEFGLPACFRVRGAPGGQSIELTGDSTEHVDIAAFALSLARHRLIQYREPTSPVLLGHSFGHLAALTCAGAFSVEDAARLMLCRGQAIATLPVASTGMACLGLSAAGTRRLLRDTGETAIACYNSPCQTVVAGPVTALSRLRSVAVDSDLMYVRLPASAAFHTHLALPAVTVMRKLATGIRQRPMRAAVFSATLRRFCTDSDDLVAQMARDMARPVHFLQAVRRLHARGASRYIECGPGALLIRLVAETVPGATADAQARAISLGAP